MIFLTYEFVAFGLATFLVYYFVPSALVRKLYLIATGYAFFFLYGGVESVVIVSAVLVLAYVAGRFGTKLATLAGIAGCGGVLLYYKYFGFLVRSLGVPPDLLHKPGALSDLAPPLLVPLGISFFTFEFIHYLVDVRRGVRPISGFVDFLCFGLFWPTMVAGPIKRFEQFIPALERGVAGPRAEDLAQGLARVALGLAKKWAADNLTGWITAFEPQYAGAPIALRWVFLAALSMRILLDFSGYSDMAIGFARMFGIRVPENFNWPYLARSPAAFWQRWHMSLSSWIRDYIYIPLGGNRLGSARRVVNGLTAMALCGLWHGPDWHFAAWGVYHGVGLASGTLVERGSRRLLPKPGPTTAGALGLLSWSGTVLFVCVGWLLFFYPFDQAARMAGQLLWR